LCISIGLKTASKSQQNALFSAKNFKNFSGEGAQPPPQTQPPMGSPYPTPPSIPHPLRPLAPRGLRPLARRLKSRPRSHFEKSAPMIVEVLEANLSLSQKYLNNFMEAENKYAQYKVQIKKNQLVLAPVITNVCNASLQSTNSLRPFSRLSEQARVSVDGPSKKPSLNPV